MLLDEVDDARTVLVDAFSGRVITAEEIRARAVGFPGDRRRLAFLIADGTAESALWFLALLEARQPVALIDPGHSWPVVSALIAHYRPEFIVDPAGNHLQMFLASPRAAHGRLVQAGVWLARNDGPELHVDLAVLLTTSGSTGSPKFVRLSAANVRTNAEQIGASLGITADDRGVTGLPLFYSYGMSVLTSHALAGSPVVTTQLSVLDEPFWSDLLRYEVSFLAGVPTTYAMLKRLGFDRRGLPSLRALTQAGGRLAPDLVTFFHCEMSRRGGRFFVMYGQTEASPRMSCLPSDRLPEKLGSVGLALAGGELSIRRDDGTPLASGLIGEVIYRGPNVMMGYADSRDDLTLGATYGSVLATGDLGYLDDEGFLYLTGRSKRICKLAGSRVSLDEIEIIATRIVHAGAQIAAVDGGDEAGVSLFAAELDDTATRQLRGSLAGHLRVPPKLINVYSIEAMPLLPNGKIDYAALTRIPPEPVDPR